MLPLGLEFEGTIVGKLISGLKGDDDQVVQVKWEGSNHNTKVNGWRHWSANPRRSVWGKSTS